MSENEHLKREFTDEERRRLVDYFSLLIEIDQQEKTLYAKLKDLPKGFAMNGEGQECGLCFMPVYHIPGWFDKWGFKCSNCQDAVNKPLYLIISEPKRHFVYQYHILFHLHQISDK